MLWTLHGERAIYESEWMRLVLADVEIPGGPRFDHHVVRMPQPAAGCVVRDPERGVLLIWRHRFITDTWGYEIPAGRVDPGEEPIKAAERECVEEAGWRPIGLERLGSFHPSNGWNDQRFDVFIAQSATYVGPPSDPAESERVEWVEEDEVRRHLADGLITEGMSVAGLLWMLVGER